MRPLFILFSFLALFAIANAQTQIGVASRQMANETLNMASNYVELVNESGYLLFYPNLTQAYADLASAERLFNTSPAGSVAFANKAVSDAKTQYETISAYRSDAFAVSLALAIVFALLLGRLMKPVKRSASGRRTK
jgi:hypothetical protein